ncbi:MAG TPA: class I SAM-dependent methyltransferase [Acidiferrobacterales bacterium]
MSGTVPAAAAGDAEAVRRDCAALFDRLAPGYDDPALRFFSFAADRLVLRLSPVRGDKILDVACGTGAVTLAAAQAVGAEGRVVGIDLAEGMLARLAEKIAKFGIANVDLHRMDAAALEFRRDYFHHVVCSFGLFFLPDMAAALTGWVRVLRPGGQLMFTSFGAGLMRPMTDLFFARLERYGAAPPPERLMAAQRLAEPQNCADLLCDAGLGEVEVAREQLGYHLKGAAEWWSVIWNSGLRAPLLRLDDTARERFRAEHLAEVEPLAGESGLWLDVEVLFSSGRKP